MRRLVLCFVAVMVAIASTAAARADGTINVAVSSNLNSLDPAKAKIGEEHLVNFLVFSGLTEIDKQMNVQPDLAESWDVSEDLQTWTFHLRRGVLFHHGRELEAKDVASTIERLLDKATGSGARSSLLIVEAVEAVDKYTVRFRLSEPYSEFAALMGERQLRIVPYDAVESLATKPIGTGPFMFKSFLPGNKVELVRNPNYFIPDLPKLDGVVFRIIPEGAARIAALESGEIDLLWNVPLESVEKVKANPDLVTDSVPTSSWDALIMDNRQKPFDDIRVRQAIAHVIDKRQMVEISLYGNGSPTHTPIPPGHPYFNSEFPIPEPDIETAKRLLTEAGYPDGFEITLYVPTGRPTRESLGIAIREALKPLNIRADIQRVPWDKFVADIEGHAAFYTDGFYSRPTPDTSTYPWYHSGGSWNNLLWHYKSEAADRLLEAARRTKSDEERKSLYWEFQEVVSREVPGVMAYVVNSVNAYSDRVKNFTSHPMMWLDLAEVTLAD